MRDSAPQLPLSASSFGYREAEDLKWKEEKQKEKAEEDAEKARAAAEAAEAARLEKEEMDKWIGTFSVEAGGTGEEANKEESQVRVVVDSSRFLFRFSIWALHLSRVTPSAGAARRVHCAHREAEGKRRSSCRACSDCQHPPTGCAARCAGGRVQAHPRRGALAASARRLAIRN